MGKRRAMWAVLVLAGCGEAPDLAGSSRQRLADAAPESALDGAEEVGDVIWDVETGADPFTGRKDSEFWGRCVDGCYGVWDVVIDTVGWASGVQQACVDPTKSTDAAADWHCTIDCRDEASELVCAALGGSCSYVEDWNPDDDLGPWVYCAP